MARRRIDRQLINRLSEEWEPRMFQAFMDSVDAVKSNVRITDLTRALERGDVEGALEIVGLDARDFRPVIRTLEQAYEGGGVGTAGAIQKAAPRGVQFVSRFDVRNVRAEQWLRERSAMLVDDFVSDGNDMLRQRLTTGMVRGQNPRQTALDLVGRVNRATGKRTGGIIGLSSELEGYERNIADMLSDPEQIRHYFIKDRETGKWKPRYKKLTSRRFDTAIRRAIENGEALPSEVRRNVLMDYRNRALKFRADRIARNETMEALNTANREAYLQGVEEGNFREQDIRRYARTAADERVRHAHRQIPGMNPNGVGLNEAFQTPNGPRMNAPFDIQCRCWVETVVDFLADALAA